MRTKKYSKLVVQLINILCSFTIIIPLIIILLTSFKNTKEANKLALSFDGITFKQIAQNYYSVFKVTRLEIAYFNSIFVTVLSVIVILVLSSMMAFIIERRRDKISEAMNYLLIAGMMLPASIVCQYFILRSLKLSGTIFGAMLVFVAINLSLSVFIYTGFYKSIPRELDESAIIDGCGPYMLFFKIIFPLLKPATVTVSIITGMSIWNNFSVSIYMLNTPKTFTVVTTLFSFLGSHSSDWNLLFADVVLISLPIIIGYVILQKFIIDGMTAGAVKG